MINEGMIKDPMMIPVVGEELTTPCALAGEEPWKFVQTSTSIASEWLNEVTLRTVEMAREIQERIPGSGLVILPEAAHFSNVEQAGGFNKALLDLLKS